MAERFEAHRRGVLLAASAAAAVAVVAAGTSYAGHGREARGAPSGEPTGGVHLPALPLLQTDAGNRAAAAAAAEAVLATVDGYPGATDSDPIRELGDDTLSTATPAGHTEVRSGFWTVSEAGPEAVARWYAAHPPDGFSSGGADAVGGEGDGTTWISEVYDDQPGTELGGPGTSVEVETTRVAAGVGVRVTVSSVWAPARPRTSYVQDVRSIAVRSVHERYGQDTVAPSRRSFTVTDPARVLRAAEVFDRLSGMTPVSVPCPMSLDVWVDRIVFHSATGDVSLVSTTSACGSGIVVRRDGQPAGPRLAGAATLLPTLGLTH